MTKEELRERQRVKKLQQHRAWKKWWCSPKGEAYKLKRKLKKALNDETGTGVK